MPTSSEIAILLSVKNQADAALAQAQKAVAGLGPAAATSARQHRRASEEMGRQNAALRASLGSVSRDAGVLFQTFRSGSLDLNLTRLGLGAIGLAAVGLGMSFNSTMQQAELAFGVLLKGPGQAQAAIAALTAVAKDLPFTLTPIIQAGQRLTSAGFADVPGLITTIADAISATGDISNEKLQSVVSSFVQLKSSGTFSMGVISDLTQAGIPVIRALAQQMGMTEFATSRMLEHMSGKVPSDFLIPKILAALRAMTGGLAAKEVNTLAGAITNLQDRFAIFMGSLTGGITGSAQAGVSALAGMFDQLTQTMKDWDPTVKKTIGWALLLGSAFSGISGAGGLFGEQSSPLGGLGATLGKLLGGGGGGGAGMIAIVIVIIALIALLTPWQAIFEAIKKAVESVLEVLRNLPRGGGGGGAPPPGGLLPVVLPVVLGPIPTPVLPPPPPVDADVRFRLPSWEELQRQVEALPEPVKRLLLLLPPFADLQAALDRMIALTADLKLRLPPLPELQGEIDALPQLQHGLALFLPPFEALQGAVDGWPHFWHSLALRLPTAEALQGALDAMADFVHGLGLRMPGFPELQGAIDAMADFVHALDLRLPTWPDLQVRLDALPDFVHDLFLLLPSFPDLQLRLDGLADLVHALDLQLPPAPDIQSRMDAQYGGLLLHPGIVLPPAPEPAPAPAPEPLPPPPGGLVPPMLPIGPGGKPPGGVAFFPDFPGGPNMPHPFAAGGIVTSPTLGVLGERGPEAVVPLSAAGLGGGPVTINLYGNVYPNDLQELIVRAIDDARRRGRTA